MSKHSSLYAIPLLLSLCGTVAAQQALVEYQDKDNPCARFKMRILMPAYSADPKILAKKIDGGIDSKMIWNPCLQDERQLAIAPLQTTPDNQRDFLVKRSFSLQFPTSNNGQLKQSGFPLFPPPARFEIKMPKHE